MSIGQGILVSLGCNSSSYVQGGQHIDTSGGDAVDSGAADVMQM